MILDDLLIHGDWLEENYIKNNLYKKFLNHLRIKLRKNDQYGYGNGYGSGNGYGFSYGNGYGYSYGYGYGLGYGLSNGNGYGNGRYNYGDFEGNGRSI